MRHSDFDHRLSDKLKTPQKRGLLFGGEAGIRTLEGLLTLAGFQDQCIQPLCHLSETVLI
jgi:hypothetical protein